MILLSLTNPPSKATINRCLARLTKTNQIIKHEIGKKYTIYFANIVDYLEKTLTLTDCKTHLFINTKLKIKNNLPKPFLIKNTYADNDNPVKKSDLQLLKVNDQTTAPKFTYFQKAEIHYTFKIPPNQLSKVEYTTKFAQAKSYLHRDVYEYKKVIYKLHLLNKPMLHPIIRLNLLDPNPTSIKLTKINSKDFEFTNSTPKRGSIHEIIWGKPRLSNS